MDFIGFMLVCIFVGYVAKKLVANKKAAEQRKQWMEHQRLMSGQVHVGEVIEPGNAPPPYYGSAPHPPPRSNWKVQAAKLGARVLIGTLIGHHHHHHGHHHDRHDS